MYSNINIEKINNMSHSNVHGYVSIFRNIRYEYFVLFVTFEFDCEKIRSAGHPYFWRNLEKHRPTLMPNEPVTVL